jgi:hypothetical protein
LDEPHASASTTTSRSAETRKKGRIFTARKHYP